MADVNINKFRASVVRDGSKPSSPGFIVSEGQDPVNPPGTNNYVPYSGATANVELGEYGVEAGFITLDTTPTNTPTDQGTIFWDADDETVDIVLNGYTMKIGEDLFYPVKNQTGSTIAKGVAVRFNGTVGASGRLLIAPFIADGSVPSSRFMGVTAEEILNGEDGKVLYFGRVRGINTNAFNEGDILYASTTVAGGYQTAIPVAPNNIVQVAAVVTKSATVGTIFVRPTLGSNINKDEGVKIVSVADKNLLQYQSGTSLWENKSLSQVLGGTSAQFVKGDGSLDSTTYGTGTVTSVGLSSATSGVTIGSSPVTTSGTITIAIATASGSQNGLLSSTDWTTFNGKQNALTNPVTGTGTTNYLPKFTGASTIGNSQVFDNGTNVGINTNSPLSTNLLGALTIVKSYSSDTPASTTAQTYYTNQSGLYLFGRNSGLTIVGANNEENQIIFANSSTVAFASINTGTGSNSTGGDMYFKVGANAERIRIYAADGNVFIGNSPSNAGFKLDVNGTGRFSSTGNALRIASTSTASNVQLYITNNNNGDVYTGVAASDGSSVFVGTTAYSGYIGTNLNVPFYIATNGTVRVTLTSGGNVQIGNDSNPYLEIANGGSADVLSGIRWAIGSGRVNYGGMEMAASSADNGYIVFKTRNSGSTAERMRITSGGNVGIGTTTPQVRLHIYDATAVRFDMQDNTNTWATLIDNSTGQYRIRYASGAINPLCITTGGNVLIGTTTDVGRVSVDYSDTNNNGISINETSGVGSTFLMLFRSQNTNKGSIQINAGNTGVNFNTTSDYRLKEDLKNYNGFEIINKIKTYDYKWKNTNFRSYGVLAHELQEIIPDVISGKKDEIDDKGNEIMQGVDYSKLVPIMVKAIQELKQEIDNLKN